MTNQLTSARMEAFSDGVIAVIITIMVLELKVPPTHEMSNWLALRGVLPVLLIYLLSFIQVGIYWVNHHYLLDDATHITHGMLWANLALLFCLSLMPFATDWVGVRGVNSFSIGLYAVASALPALAWLVLSTIICRHSAIPLAAGPLKQAVSAAFYLGAIPVAMHSPLGSICMIGTVAMMWLLPPRRIVEQTRAMHDEPHVHTHRHTGS
jgi:uncharacterized membrane protein